MPNKTFHLIKDYYTIGRDLYAKRTVTFKPGLTILVGCNGCGKTTMLTQICEKLDKDNIEYVHFNNLTDGGYFAKDKAMYSGNMDFLAKSICSSEGENIMLNLTEYTRKIARYVKKAEKINQSELWILMDGIDSGFSVDNVIDVKEQLIKTVLDDQKDKDIYILITANAYEMARDENCMDVPNCTYRKFSDYEDYRNYILETRREKNKSLSHT